MYALLTTFWLRGMTAEEYGEMAERYAPSFAEIPGLQSKLWLANDESGTYGGVYLFRDLESLETFLDSPLWRTVLGNPHLADVQAETFAVQDAPTRISAPRLVPAAAAAAAAAQA